MVGNGSSMLDKKIVMKLIHTKKLLDLIALKLKDTKIMLEQKLIFGLRLIKHILTAYMILMRSFFTAGRQKKIATCIKIF